MEGEKRMGCSSTGGSSSCFASDLFGSKDSSSSSSASSSSFSSASSGIFGSIFASNSPHLVVGRESSRAVDKKHETANRGWNFKAGHSDSMHQNKQGESQGTWKDFNNTYYTEQNVQPCPLSSSIYYGGQDIYTTSYNSQSHDNSTFKKDQGEDDSGSASRGNWWQGGLYY